jgi:MFS family permease
MTTRVHRETPRRTMEHMRAFLKGIDDPRLRRSLIYSLFDGAMWALMFGFAENYMARFAVFFGASVVELSILQGFSQLANGGGQLVGGYLVQHSGISRQRLSCLTVALHASSWLLAFLGAWISGNPLVGILIYCVGSFFTNIGSPGWSSWMNDLVPEKRRGAFWSWRNSILGLVQFAAIIAAMLFLHFAKRSKLELPAYGILFPGLRLPHGLGLFPEPPAPSAFRSRQIRGLP